MKEIRLLDKDFRLFLPENLIQKKISEMGEQISRDYKGKELLLVAILNGAFLFAADLIRNLSIPTSIQFMQIASYGNEMQSQGKANLILDLTTSAKDRHVLMLEDIVDSGLTSQFLYKHLQQHQPASLKLATLLFKPETFKATVRPDYVGFEIPPAFVVGYGMDYAQQGRGLRSIYRLTVDG